MTKAIAKPNFQDQATGLLAAVLASGAGIYATFEAAKPATVALTNIFLQHSDIASHPAKMIAATAVVVGATALNAMFTRSTAELVTYGSAVKHGRLEVVEPTENASPQPPMVS